MKRVINGIKLKLVPYTSEEISCEGCYIFDNRLPLHYCTKQVELSTTCLNNHIWVVDNDEAKELL